MFRTKAHNYSDSYSVMLRILLETSVDTCIVQNIFEQFVKIVMADDWGLDKLPWVDFIPDLDCSIMAGSVPDTQKEG